MNTITIRNRAIGPGCPPFIIAELSGNHNGSLERAKAIVKAAAEAGADAVKLQTYTADTMTIRSNKPDFFISDPKSLWHGKTLYDLYEEAHTPWEWHEPLFSYARELGLIAFSTPFDATSVDFLMTLDVPLFKIASFENTDLPLIRRVAATAKPIIISAGTATLAELEQALAAAREAGAKDIIVLKCTSAYPAPHSEANLRSIPYLAGKLGVSVGLSDHTMGIGTAVAAVALGAVVIEKHFTLSRAEGGVDAAFSLEPHELDALVREARCAWESLGSADYAPTASEAASRKYRRSLYVVKPVRASEAFTADNLRAIRPGYGLPPGELDVILQEGSAACDLEPGTALKREHVRLTD
ncbi:MAG: pseudaminic acid synthase [Pseudomonadota bacterium]|nr:pseudaminic acid synthase [Pseudomonadota bacterium]MDE3038086.1 pseudaminic acid synthase [Pseudomonadota bacterium]